MATNLLNSVKLASPIIRKYTNLAGVDFSNEASRVSLHRSPDALNVFKDYTSSGECIQTRPGHRKLAKLDDEINGLYFFEHREGFIVIVHAGTKLYKWNNYPSEDIEDFDVLFAEMNDTKSQFVVFQNVLYILDGKNYLKYDGDKLKRVSEDAYVPTTTIGREATGGGEMYQDVNLLTPKRTNQFVADGTSVAYALDATNIDSDEVTVVINDNTLKENDDFTVNRDWGIVTFSIAPEAPADRKG